MLVAMVFAGGSLKEDLEDPSGTPLRYSFQKQLSKRP